MSLRLKILAGFLILAVMLFAAGGLSVHELMNIGRSVQSLLDENYKSINAAKNMIEALEREDSGMLLLLSGQWDQGRSTIEAADRDFQDAFKTAKSNITIPGETYTIDAILAAYQHFQSFWNQPIAGTSKEGDLRWYFNRVHPAFLKSKNQVNRLMNINDQTLYTTASALEQRAKRAIMPGIVAAVSALIFTAVFNFFINLYFVSPIRKLTAGIGKFMQTGERSELSVSSRDEIGELASAVEELTIYRQEGEQGR